MNGRNIPLTQAEKLAILLQNTPQGTFPTMNLGQVTGDPRRFSPPSMPPQAQVPQQGPQAGLPPQFAMENVGGINPLNMPPQAQRPQGSQAISIPPKVMPPIEVVRPFGDITNIPFSSGQLNQNGVPLNDRTGMPLQNKPPMVPTPPDIPLRRTPSKWDLMKESIFAGEDRQGLFGEAGIDPKTKIDSGSMGLTGYFDRLFNSPGRMAMLSGGLTALDPSSYYDKEGFSSPWTGLKSGLGGAQAGYKSVIDRRKTEAEAAKLKAEAGSTMKGQPSSYKEFTLAKKQGYEGSYTDFLREMNKLKAGTMSPMGGAMKKIYENQAGKILDLQTEAEQAVIGLRNLYESKGFLDRPEGIISGPLAGIKTKFYSFLENRVGLDMGSAHANTESFLGSMGSQVGQIIKQFGSGTGLSDADRDYAKMIVGGDIELDEDSIRELMRIQEKIYRHQIGNYRSKSDPFSKGLKASGYEGMDFSINTSGLDLKSKTDWGKRDKRRTRLGHYYYDANGKKVNTIQPRTNIKKALSRVEREELIELRKQKEEGWTFPNPFKK